MITSIVKGKLNIITNGRGWCYILQQPCTGIEAFKLKVVFRIHTYQLAWEQ